VKPENTHTIYTDEEVPGFSASVRIKTDFELNEITPLHVFE
jgi:hypothetical protein